MGGHVQTLLAQSRNQLHTIDGHHISQDVSVKCHPNDILCTSWNTVALHTHNASLRAVNKVSATNDTHRSNWAKVVLTARHLLFGTSDRAPLIDTL